MSTTPLLKSSSIFSISGRYKNLLLICIALLGIFVCAASVLVYVRTPRYVRETPKSEIKKIPKDIQKRLLTASPSAQIRVPILMYHYVEYIKDTKDKMRVALNITPDIFEKQVETLKNDNYTFLTAKELGEILNGTMSMPEKPMLLTFDDGHWDFATVVLPILKKYQVKATQYVIPGFTGGSDFMTENQVWNVVASGLVDVGAHTVHHISLAGRSLHEVQDEVTESKRMLENTYHMQVVSFAYPNGSFDNQAADVVKKAGFTTGVSTVPGIIQSDSNRFFLYRLRPGHRIGEELLKWLQQSEFKPFQ